MSYRDVSLSELTLKVQNWNPRKDAPEEIVDYIDISSIDRDVKQITDISKVIGEEAPSRARQLVNATDVLVSTVRPNLNAVAYVPQELDGATASTGYCVLRCNPDKLDSRYLYHWVRTQQFIDLMILQSTGANYPAVSDKIVKLSEIPLPPLDEQRRIATILDQADLLRTLRRAALAKLDSLLQATFLDMFGDPVTNPMGWEVRKFEATGTLERGKSKHRPRNDPSLLGGPYPLIQTGEVTNAAGGYLTEYSQTYSELGLKQSKIWKAGVLCITIAANIAQTAILTFDACFPDSVVGFIPNKDVTIEYVQYWLRFLRDIIEENAPQVAQKNINLKILRELDIPVPPVDLQKTFTHAVIQYTKQRQHYQQSLTQLDKLFHSLQQRAFRGELSERSFV